MKIYLALVDEHDIIQGCVPHDDGNDGPAPLLSDPVPGCTYKPLDAELVWDRSSPTEIAKWVEGAAVWVETATLEQLRATRNQQINAWKLEANNTYFEFAGKRIAYRESDRIEIQAINNEVLLTGAMPDDPDWPAAWKTMDNTWAPIPDLATWTAFNVAIRARGTAHFKRAQELKAVLAAAATPEEINVITW